MTDPRSATAVAAVAAVAALAALAGACGDPSVMVVTVQARPAVAEVDTLQVVLFNDNATQTSDLDVGGRAFPLTFSVETGDRTGPLDILALAMDRDGVQVATGLTGTDLDAPPAAVEVMLEPDDFVVNTSYLGDQALAFALDGGGRQISVSPEGVFTIGWSDSCMVAGRCDVFGRRFDVRARPLFTALAAGENQFNINRTNNLVGYEPSMATNPQGDTLAAWSDGVDLLAVVVDGAGQATASTETVVATGNGPSTPAVAALPGGRFVVTWTESMAANYVVKARYIEATGAPAPNPITGDTGAFTVSTTLSNNMGTPSLAGLENVAATAFAWRAGTNLRVRVYDPLGQPVTPNDVAFATHPMNEVIGEPQVAQLGDDLVVTWGRVTSGGDADDGQVVVRRITETGMRVGADAVITHELPEVRPLGLTSRPDGLVAVAWPACGAQADDSGCAIRMQVLRPTLAPVGDPLLVNTTTAANQLQPSLATLPDGALVAAWSDGSQAAPDRDGFSIRARVLYPIYDDARGVLGARCTSTGECGADRACMPGSDSDPRCYRVCQPDGTCPDGGTCVTLGSERGCLF